MPTCIFKIQEVVSPYMGTPRGLRFLVAIPNKAGHNPFNGAPCASFEKPYYITHFGDYVDGADLVAHAPRIARTLKRMGWQEMVAV